MEKKKNAFTLIELVAVLVIMAIIALIVTPLVMNIVKKAKDSANKRSVDAYGKAVELAVATYLLDNGDYPTTLDDLAVEYTGNEVVCNVKTLNEDGSIYLSECSVKGRDVKDSSTEDGWYHYGKTTKTPSEEPVVYQAYNIGDTVTYNGMDFYVIENSDENSDRVTMLKAEPLTVDEVNTYGGVGTNDNHVNMYLEPTSSQYRIATSVNGYGGLAYYSSPTCGYDGSNWVSNGCTTDYAQSEVKYILNAWSAAKFSNDVLVEDTTGYSVRLITYDELIGNLGFELDDMQTSFVASAENTPTWAYNGNYRYFTMSPYNDSDSSVWIISEDGRLNFSSITYFYGGSNNVVVRPVVTLLKSAI